MYTKKLYYWQRLVGRAEPRRGTAPGLRAWRRMYPGSARAAAARRPRRGGATTLQLLLMSLANAPKIGRPWAAEPDFGSLAVRIACPWMTVTFGEIGRRHSWLGDAWHSDSYFSLVGYVSFRKNALFAGGRRSEPYFRRRTAPLLQTR